MREFKAIKTSLFILCLWRSGKTRWYLYQKEAVRVSEKQESPANRKAV